MCWFVHPLEYGRLVDGHFGAADRTLRNHGPDRLVSGLWPVCLQMVSPENHSALARSLGRAPGNRLQPVQRMHLWARWSPDPAGRAR